MAHPTLGNKVLAALKTSCATASSATWLGCSPTGDLVFVTRATCVTHADLSAMSSACRAVTGVRSVRYEVDCGDRAVRLVVTTATGNATSASFFSSPPRLPPAGVFIAEAAALAWSARALGWV